MGSSTSKQKGQSSQKENKPPDSKDAVNTSKNKKDDDKKEDQIQPNALKKQNVDLNKLTEYTLEEIGKHDKRDTGIWIIMNGLVYDVTKFMDKHPGGIFSFLRVAGEDATADFNDAQHPPEVIDQANKDFLIGKVKKE
eukprot:UN02548